MKKAMFLATLMFASANVFAMNSQSRVSEVQERSQKAEPASDQHKKLMQKDFSELMDAVKINNVGEVKKIINKHEDKSAVRDLMIAQKNKIGMSSDQLEQFRGRIFLHAAELINSLDKDKRTPLSIAAEKGYESIVKYLIEHGADVNKVGMSNGPTPLFMALYNGNENIVKYLVEHGADVNKECKGGFPLHLAAANGLEASMKYLIDHGADVNLQNDSGRTALVCVMSHVANGTGHVYRTDDDQEKEYQMVRYLLDNGADPNIGNPLLQAVTYSKQHGDTRIMQCLIDHGANVNGGGVLKKAFGDRSTECSKGELMTMKLLLDSGADPTELLESFKKEMPTKIALLKAYESEESKRRAMQEVQMKVQEADALMQQDKIAYWFDAVYNGHDKLVELFIKNGTDVNQRDDRGETALSIAQQKFRNSSNPERRSHYEKIINMLSRTQTEESRE